MVSDGDCQMNTVSGLALSTLVICNVYRGTIVFGCSFCVLSTLCASKPNPIQG